MEVKKEPVCRLCFVVRSNSFEIINDTVQEILNFLLINPDLGISNEPVVCNNCIDNLKKCFDFKKNYLHIGDTSLPFRDYNIDLNMLKIDVSRGADVTYATRAFNSSNVCYFCTNLVDSDSLVYFGKEDMDMMVMLEKYFPELARNIVKNSAACLPCHKSLQRYVSFMSNCLNVEEKIREYCRIEGTDNTGQVELSNVLCFTSKRELNVRYKLTTAYIGDEYYKQLEDVDIKVKIEECVKIEQPELDLGYGDVEIKIENNCHRLEDHLQEPKVGRVGTNKKNSGKRMYSCKFCPYQSDSPSNVRRHTVSHKSDSEVTIYKCALCTYQCRHKRYLLGHVLNHRSTSEAIVYECDLCTYQTRNKVYLHKHMYVHKKDTEIAKCDICTYHTVDKRSLKVHLRTHESISMLTAYKCNICDFTSKHKSNLARHMVKHKNTSVVTMYKCENCPFQTRYKRSLPQHMLRHKSSSEITMYECDVCKFKCKHKSNLSKHVLTQHTLQK